VDSFLKQDFEGERELIIFSTNPRIKLVCDQPNVRVANALKPCLPSDAKNTSISAIAKGDWLVNWSESDYYLPNHLKTIASRMGGDWAWLNSQFELNNGKISAVSQASEMTLAFTRNAWTKVGGSQRGVVGERNFVGKLTQACNGEKVVVSNENITFVRCGSDLDKQRARPMIRNGQFVLEPKSDRDYPALVQQFLTGKSDNKICVVILGRFGDIINVLPFIKLINDNYAKPHVGIAKEFLPLFDGIGYATPLVLADQEAKLGQAITRAKRDFPIVCVCQIWGENFQQVKTEESYNLQSWKSAGLLHRVHDESLRPVFDRRDPAREAALIAAIPDTGKPWMLVNLHGAKSAPCPECGSLMPLIEMAWGDQFQIIDIGKIRAERLYDFIGLFEKAALLVSLDTSYVHLALATNIPVVMLTRSGWGGTIMRFQEAGRIIYEDAVANPKLVHTAIEKAIRQAELNHAKAITDEIECETGGFIVLDTATILP
jgi:hypothetical protein